jgi:ammonia channel protein AmtB
MTQRRLGALVVMLALALTAAGAFAQAPASVPADAKPVKTPAAPVDPIKELTAKVAEAKVAVDTVWVLVAAFLVFFSALAWSLLKAVVGIRVPAEEEHAGLDIGEHGISAYPEFRVSGAGTASAAMDVSTPRVGTPAVERAR